MGLLDSLFSGSQGGGLLDFLRNNAMNQQMLPAGLPSDQPQYGQPPMSAMAQAPIMPQRSAQPSPLDNAQWPSGPNGAPSQANAQMPAQPPQEAQALPPALGGNSFGGNLGASLQSFANAPGGLISKLAGGTSALVTGERTDPQGIQQQNLKAQYQAFIGAGLSPQKAMLAVMNPEAAKTLVGEALTNKEKWGEIGSDSFGNKQFGWINDREQTVNGKPMSDTAANGSSMGFMAPGVKQVDSTLTGQDYLKQFSPEVQAAVQNYIDGKSTPTGNPRKGFTQTVKMIAQKVGDDTGQSVDDTTYAARRTMRNQLSSSAPSSLGGQINIGNTAAGHLADLSQKAVELGNYDTGIAPLTSLVNSARGLGTEQAAKMEALKGAAQHYGQEITKFYAGSPGGVAERDRFIESVNGARSPKELAAILATEGELMRSRLDALGGQIKGVLGDEGLKQYPVLRPDGQAGLAKVEENVSRLKGNAQSAPQQTPPAPKPGMIQGGYRFKGGNPADKNNWEQIS